MFIDEYNIAIYYIFFTVPECTTDIPPACMTCCCNSTDNVEFYEPPAAEHECTAPPAIYKIIFHYTWNDRCQPEYYLENASWSRPIAVSHNNKYRMWDACMTKISRGVIIFSQTGNRTVITGEGANDSVSVGNILDGPIFDGDSIPQGDGMTSIYLTLDRYHQYVSTLTKLNPSYDQIVGVADLRLCDGKVWKKGVKVCMELFSTGTTTNDMLKDVKRKSVQENNCSFGYLEFHLIKSQVGIYKIQ